MCPLLCAPSYSQFDLPFSYRPFRGFLRYSEQAWKNPAIHRRGGSFADDCVRRGCAARGVRPTVTKAVSGRRDSGRRRRKASRSSPSGRCATDDLRRRRVRQNVTFEFGGGDSRANRPDRRSRERRHSRLPEQRAASLAIAAVGWPKQRVERGIADIFARVARRRWSISARTAASSSRSRSGCVCV